MTARSGGLFYVYWKKALLEYLCRERMKVSDCCIVQCHMAGPKLDVPTLAALSGTALLGELPGSLPEALQLGAPGWFTFLELLCTE